MCFTFYFRHARGRVSLSRRGFERHRASQGRRCVRAGGTGEEKVAGEVSRGRDTGCRERQITCGSGTFEPAFTPMSSAPSQYRLLFLLPNFSKNPPFRFFALNMQKSQFTFTNKDTKIVTFQNRGENKTKVSQQNGETVRYLLVSRTRILTGRLSCLGKSTNRGCCDVSGLCVGLRVYLCVYVSGRSQCTEITKIPSTFRH